MTPDDAYVGARVTHTYSPDRSREGTIVEVDGSRVFVAWDRGSPHHLSDLCLLPDHHDDETFASPEELL